MTNLTSPVLAWCTGARETWSGRTPVQRGNTFGSGRSGHAIAHRVDQERAHDSDMRYSECSCFRLWCEYAPEDNALPLVGDP
jgi:hypothetical protein